MIYRYRKVKSERYTRLICPEVLKNRHLNRQHADLQISTEYSKPFPVKCIVCRRPLVQIPNRKYIRMSPSLVIN